MSSRILLMRGLSRQEALGALILASSIRWWGGKDRGPKSWRFNKSWAAIPYPHAPNLIPGAIPSDPERVTIPQGGVGLPAPLPPLLEAAGPIISWTLPMSLGNKYFLMVIIVILILQLSTWRQRDGPPKRGTFSSFSLDSVKFKS